ncbi:MAG: hypothetical protein IT428_32420 [Planctomycetaceae bacterium]|nr:hypothetical protein [Planctomycetaceae bacterium]
MPARVNHSPSTESAPAASPAEGPARAGFTGPALSRRSVLWMAGAALVPSGCMNTLLGQRNQYGPPPTGASKSEIFKHLNGNISKIYAWRSTSITIHSRLIPMRLSGQVAVESPRSFRMRVTSVAGDEADFGSNPERFWFWMRRNEPKHVYSCRHNDMGIAAQRLPLPFQPDWLIEVLGVIPLDESQFHVDNTDARTYTVTMSSEQLSPRGEPVKRLLLVDAQHGVVLGHSLFDARGQLIAKATLKNYRFHPLGGPHNGVNFPHTIDLDWPQANMAMTLNVGRDVEINPSGMPDATFLQPRMDGFPEFDLGR